MLPDLVNMWSWWQWLIAAAVPPAIIALYFLKLKRRPLEVPSTYLWHKSIEDLHVNALWQRLRRNLLLWLQLLIVALVMLALLRPGWRGTRTPGNRLVFLVDNSASMQATDVAPSRLAEAQRRVREWIERMDSGDVAMIVSFAETARIEQTFTDNRALLFRGLAAIQPTQQGTSLAEALRVAAVLANPGRSGAVGGQDVQVADPLPAKLVIVSDGKFDDVSGFALGNLDPVFVPIGVPDAANLAIVAAGARPDPARPDQFQVFAQLENFSAQDATTRVELLLDDRLIDAQSVTLPAGKAQGVVFDRESITAGVLHLHIATTDHLRLDDDAWLVLRPARQARLLLATPGNEPLATALQTGRAGELAKLEIQAPSFLQTAGYEKNASQGQYELVIYDRCRPKSMPQANTLFIGTVPPASGWSAKPKVDMPQIIDVDPAHPLMQWVTLGAVALAEGTPLAPPPGATVLIDSDVGPLLAVAPRDRFEDAVLGFLLVEQAPGSDGKTGTYFRTDWPFRPSFPLFVLNALEYFGGQREQQSGAYLRPGQTVSLKGTPGATSLAVSTPAGQRVELKPVRPGEFSFTQTAQLGVYRTESAAKNAETFAVSLCSRKESDIRPQAQPTIRIGYVEVAGDRGVRPYRREIWKGLLLAALAVTLVEWYIYNQRVFG